MENILENLKPIIINNDLDNFLKTLKDLNIDLNKCDFSTINYIEEIYILAIKNNCYNILNYLYDNVIIHQYPEEQKGIEIL